MIKTIFISIILSGVFIFLFPLIEFTYAATLQIDPATVTTAVDKTFEVKISVNSGGEEINGVDAFIIYDANILEAQSISDGSFFPTVLHDIKKAGRAYIAGMVDNPGTFKIGAGTIATIIFKAKKNGATTVVFDCTQGSTTDSNVVKNDLNATDIILCASNGSLKVTVESASTTTTTATVPTAAVPTATPAAVATNAPTQTAAQTAAVPQVLPKSGVFENITRYATPGIVLVIVGFGMRLLL